MLQSTQQVLILALFAVCLVAHAVPAEAQYYGDPGARFGALTYGYMGRPYVDYGYYDGGVRFFDDYGYYDGGYFGDFGYYDNWYTDATRFGYGYGGFPPYYYGNYYTPNWYDWGW